jgi:multidrug efflux pump subunit AcrA (membrane-fusion protein)
MTFDSFPDEQQEGPLYYISYTPKAGETGTVYEGRIRITSNDILKYRYGMTGDIEFLLNEKNNVVAIPSNYVRSDSKGKFIMKKVGDKQVRTSITVGNEIDGYYEVKKGVEEGDIIFITK